MGYLMAFLIAVAGAAVNVAYYVQERHVVNLGGAIFCGGLALWVQAVGE